VSLVNVLFAVLAVFGTGSIALVAAVVFWMRGSLHPFQRGVALACSFMAGAVLGCAASSVVASFLFFQTNDPHSSTAVAVFLGTIFGTGLISGCLAAWIVDRFVVHCLWWGNAAARRAP
jgi:hypothetical protein